jgi:hypothetical protein
MNLPRTVFLHIRLRRVAAGQIVWHPGCFGVIQGWALVGGARLAESAQEAMSTLLEVGLIDNGVPPKERPSDGNPVTCTDVGGDQLSIWNASVRARVAA